MKNNTTWPDWVFVEGNKILNKIDWTNCDISPQKELVLRFTNLDLSKIKVVILGKDPYPGKGIANGLSFGTDAKNYFPFSLQTILKEVKQAQGFVKTNYDLVHWEKQGVLLLNTCLTKDLNSSKVHSDLWNDYIKRLIAFLNENFKLIWVLWGSFAQNYESLLNKDQIIIKDAHPSPLARKWRKGHTFIELQKLTTIIW